MVSGTPHSNAGDCIATLRDRIADLEFRVEQLVNHRPTTRRVKPPKYNMIVVLDGERVPLAEAAGRLGITPKVLYERIYTRLSRNRTRRGVRVAGADLRELGVDAPQKPWGAKKNNE